jgi:hypothetical protein
MIAVLCGGMGRPGTEGAAQEPGFRLRPLAQPARAL